MDDRRDDLIELIQKLQLEIGLVMETWADKLTAPIPSNAELLAAHIANIRQAAREIVALTEASEALRQRLECGEG